MNDLPFYKIHNINKRFNEIFDIPLFCVAFFVTLLNFFLPYSLRTALAFLINIFFNRPIVYLHFFAENVSKRIQFVVLALFYYTVVGAYALVYQATYRFSGARKKTNWKNTVSGEDANYLYQS